MKVLDYGAERKWQGLSALSVPLLPKPLLQSEALRSIAMIERVSDNRRAFP